MAIQSHSRDQTFILAHFLRNNRPAQMQQRILVATSLPFRRHWYRCALRTQDAIVETAASGTECIEKIRDFLPDLLILETFLLWGGSEGVLAVCEGEDRLKSIAVLVIDIGHDPEQTYQIGAFALTNYWRRYPTAAELCNAVQTLETPLTLGQH